MSLVNYEDIYEEFLILSSSPKRSSNSGNKYQNITKTNKSYQYTVAKDISPFSGSIATSNRSNSLQNCPNSINLSILKMGGEDAISGVNPIPTTLTSGPRIEDNVERPTNSLAPSAPCEVRQQFGEKRSEPSSLITSLSQNTNGPPPTKRAAVGLVPSTAPPSVPNSNPSYHALDGQQFQGNHHHPYYPYTGDFQYPSPHFLTGGCLQPTASVPGHMNHHTPWNFGQGHTHPMVDHNYVSHSTSVLQNLNNQNNLHHQQQQFNGTAGQQYPDPSYQNTANVSQSQLQGNGQHPFSNQTLTSNRSSSSWTLNTESIYPGGLEVLWREVPEECQKLMTVLDVPDSARFRGYFTVCELISLKRSLMARISCNNKNKVRNVQSNSSNETGVGLAVKEAMNTLDDDDLQILDNNNVKSEYCDVNVKGVVKSTLGNSIDSPVSSASASSTSTTVTSVGNSASAHQSLPLNINMGPPPPYRTATLVFKLLQIGGYQFRSFSEMNPNRLRVLFNTQRLTYECQLSVVRPPRDGMQPLRKLLTVDIGFDQISIIRFGTDKLFLKVEGAPLLTVTYNPANDDSTCPPLSPQDHQLLDQIDKGQLKLSPCHQLYFLNERLVHLLEAQFREHPRFRHILQNAFQPNPPQSQQAHQPVSTNTSHLPSTST